MRVVIFKKSTLIRSLVVALLLIGAALYARIALAPKTESAAAPAETRALVCSVKTDKKIVALTFDTAFGDDQTEEILKILEEHNTAATFAVMGAWAKENEELVCEIDDAGHEIISHSMEHGRYPDMTEEEILADAKAAKAAILHLAGVNTNMIRAPYGAYDDKTVSALKNAGFLSIKWSLDSRDWEDIDAQTILKNVMKSVVPGDILIFQNDRAATVEALPAILDALAERNYRCVTLSELTSDLQKTEKRA